MITLYLSYRLIHIYTFGRYGALSSPAPRDVTFVMKSRRVENQKKCPGWGLISAPYKALLWWCSFFEKRRESLRERRVEWKPPPSPPPYPELSPSPRIWGNKRLSPERPRAETVVLGPHNRWKSQKSTISWNFMKFHKIPGILLNSRNFEKIMNFGKTGPRFAGMLKTSVIHRPF